MTSDSLAAEPSAPPSFRRLRLWPVVAIGVVEATAIFLPEWVFPSGFVMMMTKLLSVAVGTLLLLIWWLGYSRAYPLEKIIGLTLVAAGFGAACYGVDKTMLPMGIVFFGFVGLAVSWAVGALLFSRTKPPMRSVAIGFCTYAMWLFLSTLRLDGMTGGFDPEFRWRWAATAEQQFLADRGERKEKAAASNASAELVVEDADWPGFRGPKRDGVRTGVRLETDWKANLPKLLWKQRIGPGWSSYAVVGELAFTQEQRGDKEAVVCCLVSSGKEVWSHEDDVRHADTESGAGPRGTPEFSAGRIYSFGATGLLNCLDAKTGKKIWSRDVAKETKADRPQWGFSSSPLVAAGVVSVFAGGKDGKAIVGYHADTGEPAWQAGDGKFSYSSTQLVKIGGTEQVLSISDVGLHSLEPATGKVLWRHAWDGGQAYRCVQPGLAGDDGVIIGTPMGVGIQLVGIAKEGVGWKTTEKYKSTSIKPYYNDMVVHKGFGYGFDTLTFMCFDVKTGEPRWRARGYGAGQVVLLPEQDLLLVVAESGDVALLDADPKKKNERTRFSAVPGKTWNHPVLVRDKLLVRNSEWAACYQLPLAK